LERIKVLIHGLTGKMGQAILPGIYQSQEVQLVAGVSRNMGVTESVSLPDGSGYIAASSDLRSLLDRYTPDVVVDFTSAQGALTAARISVPQGVHLVIGSTGLQQSDLDEIQALCNQHQVGAVVAPNFALGAVILIHLAKQLGNFFPYADVIEMHHEAKQDSPSGTSRALASALIQGGKARFERPMPDIEPVPGTRGGELDGVSIHAIRMAGKLAHHEIILGTLGQTLTLRHDTISRECYVPGILASIQYVVQSKGLTIGLETILGLE
jgi:4-hydroxy-tetrahydrodipicolinate reductase